jgi:hypothetical protein
MMTDTNSSDLLTPQEASAMLRVTKATLEVWRCHGKNRKKYPKTPKLPYVKLGSKIAYKRRDLESFIEQGTVEQD